MTQRAMSQVASLLIRTCVCAGLLLASACGPDAPPAGHGVGSAVDGVCVGNTEFGAPCIPTDCKPEPEICGDGIDQDCDGSDVACPGQPLDPCELSPYSAECSSFTARACDEASTDPACLPGGGDAPQPSTEAHQVDIDLTTVSRCHKSEYDHIVRTLAAFTNPGTGKPDKDFIITLETNAASLGHVVVETANLKAPRQNVRQKEVQQFSYPMTVDVPKDLAEGGEFTAYLFACVDLDGDRSCTDEAAGSMEGSDFKTDVVYFVPVKVLAKDGDLSFRTPTEDDEVENPDPGSEAAAKALKSLLNNLTGADVGEEAVNPLSIFLTVTAAKACPRPSPRTNGCFVAGTLVSVGGGELVPVEELYRGTQMVTANGQQVVAIKQVAGAEEHPVVEIQTEAGHAMTVTRFHPMMTDSGLKLAADLTLTDQLIDAAWNPVAIASLNRSSYAGLVYNFELPGVSTSDHLVVAQGLVTGDLHLQQQLAAAAH